MPNREITRRNKKKYLKEQKYASEETNEIKRFIIILFSLIICIIIVYVISNTLVKKEKNTTNTVKTGEIDYNIVSVGTILNRKENEYYVLVYDQESSESSIYATYGALYANSTDAKALYYCDLSNEINKNYVATDGSSNPNAKKIEDFKFGELTLLKIKDKKIVKYLEDVDAIKKELGI